MGNNAVHGSLKRKRKKSSETDSEELREVTSLDNESIMDFYDKRDEKGEDPFVDDEERSQIEEYYRGKNILLTGASGFVGTILLEKLLRTMDVGRIYVLFRGKKSQSLDARLRDYFAEDAFDLLRKEKRDFHRKVVVLDADLQSEGLGLKDHERRVLIENVQLIFHVAATVKFDEPLNVAYDINCKGTETLLNLAEQFKRLESFVYVSTAYSNCHFKNIVEKFYEPVYTCTQIKQIIDSCSSTELTVLNDLIIKPMPNTYTITKHANEEMCRLKLDKVPLAIVRPSIVMPVVEEPCAMWMKGMNGLTAMYVAVGSGVMRTVYQSTNNTIDIVPGDIAINSLIAVGWERGMRTQALIGSTVHYGRKNSSDENNNLMGEKDVDNKGNKKDYNSNSKICNKGPRVVKVAKTDRFVDEHNNDLQDTDDSISDITSDDASYNPIYHMVSCVENPIKLGKSTEFTIHFNKESKEGCEKCLWTIHHNPTNNKWLYFFYFYLYNLLPTFLFFVFLEKLSGKKAQLMKIYRKIFFLNNTIANFSINEWTFTNNNALALQDKMCPKDKQKYSFSVKNLRWSDYHLNLYRCLARYALGSYTSKEVYNTRVKYMHMVDFILINGIKLLLGYMLYCLVFMILSRFTVDPDALSLQVN